MSPAIGFSDPLHVYFLVGMSGRESRKALFRLLSRREILDNVLASDIVFEILDARIPEYLRNRFLERVAMNNGKRLVLVLNKSDLVPRSVISEWINYYRDRGLECIATSASTGDIRAVKRILREAGREIMASFFGAPKVGKSSLVNTLKGKKSATVSRYPGTPGYTKGIQVYRIYRNVYIIDTPGSLPIDADRLEMIIRTRPPEKIENPLGIAIELIERIERIMPGSIERAYGVSGKPLEILEVLAIKRGWILRGSGEPNIEEAAREIIRSYLDGRIRFYTKPDHMDIISKA
ncbi:MAG: GTPase RsgA [Sulfolobales archaeon]